MLKFLRTKGNGIFTKTSTWNVWDWILFIIVLFNYCTGIVFWRNVTKKVVETYAENKKKKEEEKETVPVFDSSEEDIII